MDGRAPLFFLFLPLSFAAGPAPAQDVDPALLAASCAGCHGTDGQSPSAIPDLAGERARDLLEDMKDFKEGDSGTVMTRIIRGYTDEEMEVLAKYFSERR